MIEVSVLIVTYNEEDYILNCIQSIENQFYNHESWELIIVDGGSTDHTLELSNNYLRNKPFNWKLLNNPQKVLAAGWNIGIRNAKGKFVVRPDAHAAFYKDYIKNGLQILAEKQDVSAVGGILETKASGFWGKIIKEALSSKIGVGNSHFRTGAKSDYTDTSVYAIYRKELFDVVGYFDENLVRHQDNDMHKRIKEHGGKFYTSVDMIADYFSRDSLKKLVKQMYNIGVYLPDIMTNKSFSTRHLVPLMFVLGIVGMVVFGLLISRYFMYLLFSVLIIYFSIILLFSLSKVIQNKNIMYILISIVIPLIHFPYGVGTAFGLIRKALKRK